MDPEQLNEKPDMTLGSLARQDLYTMSVSDLEECIMALKGEITRCQSALGDRGSTRDAAEKLFKS